MEKDQLELANEQVSNLIGLVMDGQNPDDLINSTVESIREGYGNGPYPIGSKVKVNQSWAGEAIGGGAASLAKDEFVWVLQTGVGESGYDRIVLFPNGTTKAIVPLKILGEGIDEQDIRTHGPKGHEVSAAGGSAGGSISGKAQGDKLPTSPAQPQKGKLVAIPSTFVGKGKPKDDPAAQPMPAMAATTVSGKTVEDVQKEVIETMTGLLQQAGSPAAHKVIKDMMEDLQESDVPDYYAVIHHLLHAEEEITLAMLNGVYEACKKKKSSMKEDEFFSETDLAEIFQVMKGMKKKSKK